MELKKSSVLLGINIENLETLKYHIFFKKTLGLLFAVTVVMIIKNMFKEEESVEILKIVCLSNSIE